MSVKRRDSTPRIVEVPDDSDEVLDWGSCDEITDFARSPGAIRVDNYYHQEDNRDRTGGVFDDHYDPRQVTLLSTNAIHANLYQQYNSHVAYNIIKMTSLLLLKTMVLSKQLIKKQYYKYKDMVPSSSNTISWSRVNCAPSLVNYSWFTMHLKYLTNCFQLEVYCRKDIA